MKRYAIRWPVPIGKGGRMAGSMNDIIMMRKVADRLEMLPELELLDRMSFLLEQLDQLRGEEVLRKIKALIDDRLSSGGW